MTSGSNGADDPSSIRGSGHHYFTRISAQEFVATPLVQGAWDGTQQHVAPAFGLIAHAIEVDLGNRRNDGLRIGRVSYDILGTMPIGTVAIEVVVIRPGRTVELVEASLLHSGRLVILARAWLMQTFDTERISGSALPAIPSPKMMPHWDITTVWAGACIASLEARREELSPGRATTWLRTDVSLLDREKTSATAGALAMVDVANGLAMRISPDLFAFPNVDLTVHLLRRPTEGWLGFDTTASYSTDGIGMTHSILHDLNGVLGTVIQAITVRQR